MIVVCEPLCKNFSHEKVNSGFLLGLRMAFPLEPIRVHAHATHIQALLRVLAIDGKAIPDIEFVPIEYGGTYGIRDLLEYRRVLCQVFSSALAAGTDRIFFLSFNPVILALIKWIRMAGPYTRLKLTFVLHGDFEEIADDRQPSPAPPLPGVSIGARLKRVKPLEMPAMALRQLRARLKAGWQQGLRALLSQAYPMKRALLWRHSASIRYIALAPHILANANKYVDAGWLNITVVPMPVAFAEPLPQPVNRWPKFAVFGYGDSAMLHQVLLKLAASRAADSGYEIRVIGMDDRGTAGFRNVTTPSPGKPMAREDMGKQAEDIDAFLILYTKERYRLSCSGSILEALSYMKPVLHFDNDCVNSFNLPYSPIGIRSDSIDEFVGNLVAIIEDYPGFVRKASTYRKNLLKRRAEFAIEGSLDSLRNSFTWPLSDTP